MPLKTHLDEQPALNLTPMIDIVFLLIIFFMVGTRFAEAERKITLKVPEVAKSGALSSAPERKIVNIQRDGTISLGRTDVTLDQLIGRLRAARRQYGDLGVLVRGDARVEHRHVATVLGACRVAGIRNLGISVRPKRLRK